MKRTFAHTTEHSLGGSSELPSDLGGMYSRNQSTRYGDEMPEHQKNIWHYNQYKTI